MEIARLSELRGRTLSKAIRFNSRYSFQPVPATSGRILDLFRLGP